MLSSSGRAQVEPLAALAAVFALGVGLTLYAGTVDSTLPSLTTDRAVAPTAADRLVAEASSLGAVEPPLERAADSARPTGYELNVTLRADGTTWTAGASRRAAGDCHRRGVSAHVAPGQVRPALLEVCVWRAR